MSADVTGGPVQVIILIGDEEAPLVKYKAMVEEFGWHRTAEDGDEVAITVVAGVGSVGAVVVTARAATTRTRTRKSRAR